MTDPQSWVAPTFDGLADLLADAPQSWDTPSLCDSWLVRHVVAHVTMPARLTPEQYGAELTAAGGDFTVLSNTVAARDAQRPASELVAELRSPQLHAWQPPGGGAAGALSHAVIHSLDITIALSRAHVAPDAAVIAVLDQLTAAHGTLFGLNLDGLQLEATDTAWSWCDSPTVKTVKAGADSLVALLAGRTLPDGGTLADAS